MGSRVIDYPDFKGAQQFSAVRDREELALSASQMADANAVVARQYEALASGMERLQQLAERLAGLPPGLGYEGPRNEARVLAATLPAKILTLRSLLERA